MYTIYIHLLFTYYSTVFLQSIQCIDLHGLLDVHRSRLWKNRPAKPGSSAVSTMVIDQRNVNLQGTGYVSFVSFRRVCIPLCWIKTGWFLVDDSVMRVLLWVDDNLQQGLGQHQAHWHETHLLGRCCLKSCSQRCSYDVSSDKMVGVRSSF